MVGEWKYSLDNVLFIVWRWHFSVLFSENLVFILVACLLFNFQNWMTRLGQRCMIIVPEDMFTCHLVLWKQIAPLKYKMVLYGFPTSTFGSSRGFLLAKILQGKEFLLKEEINLGTVTICWLLQMGSTLRSQLADLGLLYLPHKTCIRRSRS